MEQDRVNNLNPQQLEEEKAEKKRLTKEKKDANEANKRRKIERAEATILIANQQITPVEDVGAMVHDV